MAETRLSKFLLSLAEDNKKVVEFKKNPLNVMTKAKLSAKERAIVLSANPKRIATALRPSVGRGHIVVVTVVVVVRPKLPPF